MGEVYFIRHGQASFGTANYDRLSPLGHQQAEWLGQYLAATGLQFDHVITGTLRRHRETLAAMNKALGIAAWDEDIRLNEMAYFAVERAFDAQYGDSPADTPDAMAAQFVRVMDAYEQDRISDVPERFADFRARVLAALDDHGVEGKRVLIVSSGGPKGIVMRHALGLDGAAMNRIILGTMNSSLSRFLNRSGTLLLSQYNAVPHLDQPERHHAQTYI
ncbi:MAG: histidine phosphatase family protein [Rhodobacteraceae bacterium]|nr:histidine phosphatase family protein [Paracoccaceae bacterium]